MARTNQITLRTTLLVSLFWLVLFAQGAQTSSSMMAFKKLQSLTGDWESTGEHATTNFKVVVADATVMETLAAHGGMRPVWKIRVPKTHLLRLIDNHVSFGFVRERLRNGYSESGRPRRGHSRTRRDLLLNVLLQHARQQLSSQSAGIARGLAQLLQ
jgi:hypothetical protein